MGRTVQGHWLRRWIQWKYGRYRVDWVESWYAKSRAVIELLIYNSGSHGLQLFPLFVSLSRLKGLNDACRCGLARFGRAHLSITHGGDP